MADALDAVVVVDFQHTSLTGGGTSEIIEFPWIVFDLATGAVCDEHRVLVLAVFARVGCCNRIHH